MLLTAHAMGSGADLLSGWVLHLPRMKALFRLSAHEQPLCFMNRPYSQYPRGSQAI